MLQEITNLAETNSGLKRRWFSDASMDLYVWYDKGGNIVQFQLCYDKDAREQALTWSPETGCSHLAVLEGDSGPDRMKGSPVMTEDGNTNIARAGKLFTKAGSKLEHDLFEFIINCLNKS